MNATDASTIGQLALLAALADGTLSPEEQAELSRVAGRLGVPASSAVMDQAQGGQASITQLAASLSDTTARRTAYEVAVAICNADRVVNPREKEFLEQLRSALKLDAFEVRGFEQEASAIATAPVASGKAPPATDADLDTVILDQAMLTGALELLPDGLASMAILPLQMRLVYQVGQRYGQQLDANQIKDLAGTLGIGAAAQVVEGLVRKVLGNVAGGLLGNLLGGAAGTAAGVTVSFVTTYALGHVAKQYYAQGRTLSADDLKALFTRFQGEARDLLPRVQGRIQTLAGNLRLPDVLRQIRGM
jgi:tellurite resistance protein/uncharacterized protein (DUF697 family)